MLHRVDSTFHMNLTRTPTESNVETLRKQFPHLQVKSGSTSKQQKATASKAAGPRAKDASAPGAGTPKSNGNGNGKPDQKKEVTLTFPDLSAAPASSASGKAREQRQQPEKKAETSAASSEAEKKSKRAASPVESEEEDDDDDGGLTVEYPSGEPYPSKFRAASHFSPPFPAALTRRFSEFARDIEREEEYEDQRDEFRAGTAAGYGEEAEEAGYEEEDEDDEEEDEEREHFPEQPLHPGNNSTMNNPGAVEPDRYTFDNGDEDDDDQDFGDLEAEMERELAKAQDEGHESDVSEEE